MVGACRQDLCQCDGQCAGDVGTHTDQTLTELVPPGLFTNTRDISTKLYRGLDTCMFKRLIWLAAEGKTIGTRYCRAVNVSCSSARKQASAVCLHAKKSVQISPLQRSSYRDAPQLNSI